MLANSVALRERRVDEARGRSDKASDRSSSSKSVDNSRSVKTSYSQHYCISFVVPYA